jgi:hypothetical protein
VKKVLLALGLGALAACSDATSPSNANSNLNSRFDLATGNNVAVVKEGDVTRQVENTDPTDNWVLYTRPSTTGAASFIAGPAIPPRGNGSLQLSTPDGSAKVFLFNYDHVGTPLADVDAIEYDTYRSAGSAQQVAALNVQVDFNGPSVEGGFTTLIFEPVYNTIQGAVANDVWQHWDAFSSGNAVWWSSRAIPGVCAFDCFVSWSTIVAANPNATILGGFGVNQGSGNGGLTTSVDMLKLGVSGSSITYDFEDSACHFTTDGSNYNLEGDCTTTSTIIIPNGLTLQGNGHTITAKDPAGGHFLGAVVTNGGATNSVNNVTITAGGLTDVCDGGADRLRGILFDGATGSITDNVVTGVRQGPSGCQEGNAIEVRNAPFSETGPISVGPDVSVTISGNVVSDYQKNGITVNGAVIANVFGNSVTGDGPVSYIAQNGIQIGFGGSATVKSNTVAGNFYAPVDTEACGLLFYRADGVKSSANKFSGNEVNQCNYGKGGGKVDASN